MSTASFPRPGNRDWSVRAENLYKRYGPQVLFEQLSFQASPGTAIRISGPNGSGKTQLLLGLAGLVRMDEGLVSLEQRGDAGALNGTPWQRDSMVRFVPSLPGEVADLPTALAAYVLSRRLSPFSFRNADRIAAGSFFPEWQERLEAVVGGPLEAERRMRTLSIGQQKRLLLASVLMCAPRALLYLVDEPLAGLDRGGVEVALRLLAQVRTEHCAILIAEHRDEMDGFAFDAEIRMPCLRPARSADAREATSDSPGVEAGGGSSESLESLLEVGEARVGFPNAEIRCPKLVLRPGELAVIEGANGAGKTGFLRGLLGLRPASFQGDLRLRGARVSDLQRAQAEGRVRYLDQTRSSFDGLHVLDALRVAAPSQAALPEEIHEVARHLGPGRRVAALSAGSRALLALGQTLVTGPELALLDEPFANVDRTNRQRMRALIRSAQARWNTAFLIVEHTGVALSFARRFDVRAQGERGMVLTEVEGSASKATSEGGRNGP